MAPMALITRLKQVKKELPRGARLHRPILLIIQDLLVMFKQNILVLHVNHCLSQPPAEPHQQLEPILDAFLLKMTKFDLKELIMTYIREQDGTINAKRDICRICETNIRIEFIEQHLQYCEKMVKENRKLKDDGEVFAETIRLVN
jgi:hypothetical protein